MPDGLLGYRRIDGTDDRVVVINFSDRSVLTDDRATGDGDDGAGHPAGALTGRRVELSSDGSGEGQPFDGRMAPDQAVVLGP